MFSASKLTPEQVASLKQRAAEGASMSDLQRHLKDEFGITITYMDTRFLILDLGIELIEETKEEPKEEAAEKPEVVPTGEVTVTMDTLALPGALVSGKVTFSDGESAVWMLDQTGRPDAPVQTQAAAGGVDSEENGSVAVPQTPRHKRHGGAVPRRSGLRTPGNRGGTGNPGDDRAHGFSRPRRSPRGSGECRAVP